MTQHINRHEDNINQLINYIYLNIININQTNNQQQTAKDDK